MSEVTASPPLRIAGATSYTVLCVLSLSLNAVLITIFVKHRKDYIKSSFYVLTWQLIVGDVLTQAIELVVAVPITYTALPLYGGGTLLHILLGIDTIAYSTTVIFSILMTFNRAAIFLLPKVYKLLFEANTRRTIAACWLLVFGVPAGLNASGCYKIFVTNGFYLTYLCETPLAQTVKSVWYHFASYAPVAMIAAYLGIFAYMRYKLSTFTRRASQGDHDLKKAITRRERRLLFQSFLICGTLELQNLVFQFFPLLVATGTQWHYVVNFASNSINIVCNTMTPIVLFTFNRDVRRRLRGLFGADITNVVEHRSLEAVRVTPAKNA